MEGNVKKLRREPQISLRVPRSVPSRRTIRDRGIELLTALWKTVILCYGESDTARNMHLRQSVLVHGQSLQYEAAGPDIMLVRTENQNMEQAQISCNYFKEYWLSTD
jgi:hypothetical protein